MPSGSPAAVAPFARRPRLRLVLGYFLARDRRRIAETRRLFTEEPSERDEAA